MNLKSIEYPLSNQNLPIYRLKKVLSDLKESSDIEGAILIKGKRDVIALDLPNSQDYEKEIPKILVQLEELGGFAVSKRSNIMFAHHIFDYNGCKILAKRMKNLTLLVMLQKRGYIGLAMLEIENSIRRIHEILHDTSKNHLGLADMTN